MGTIAGLFGSGFAAVVTIVSAAVGIVAIVILWKAGILPVLAEGFLLMLRGIFVEIPVAVFNFLRDLLAFAAA